MSEQSIDLRSTFVLARRHAVVLSIVAAAGAAAGAALALVEPPTYTSTSSVILSPMQTPDGQMIVRDIATQIKVAGSEAVLGPAGGSLDPAMSATELAGHITVDSSSNDILVFTARGSTPEEAQERAKAVANAEVAYWEQAGSSLDNAQRAALSERAKTLTETLDVVLAQIKQIERRQDTQDPKSDDAYTDRVTLSQLTGQRADLALKIEQVREQAEAGAGSAVPAGVLEKATPALYPGIVSGAVLRSVLGLVLAVVIGIVVLAVRDRRDRRVRYRDEIADALGSPVVASIGVRPERSVAGWASMLQTYAPGTVDAWALRQILRGMTGQDRAGGALRASSERHGKVAAARDREGSTVLVVSLSDDPKALAVGPQLASYAASIGIRTRLHAAQRHESAAALWAACHRGMGQEEVRPGLFVDTGATGVPEPELTVVIAVLDRQNPTVSLPPDADRALVAVSPGSLTAEEIARAAVAADDAGCDLSGLIVADPDDLDRTTGRLLAHERTRQVSLPARITGGPGPSSGPTATVKRPS